MRLPDLGSLFASASKREHALYHIHVLRSLVCNVVGAVPVPERRIKKIDKSPIKASRQNDEYM